MVPLQAMLRCASA